MPLYSSIAIPDGIKAAYKVPEGTRPKSLIASATALTMFIAAATFSLVSIFVLLGCVFLINT